MRRLLRDYYLSQTFDPGVAGLLLNPFYHARKGLYRAIAGFAGAIRGQVLDVGCGQKPYECLFTCERYVGLEFDSEENRRNKKADCFYDGGVFPFAADNFDAVVCNQVLEHVFNPDDFVGEIVRVLKPGGTLLLTVPFAWDEHEQPYDYARYSSFGLRALLERNGLAVESMVKTNAGVRAIAQLAAAYLYKVTRTGRFAIDVLIDIVLIAPVNICGVILGAVLPATPDFYLDNVVLAKKGQSVSRK
jgi:SAM-dependent methyltransferase